MTRKMWCFVYTLVDVEAFDDAAWLFWWYIIWGYGFVLSNGAFLGSNSIYIYIDFWISLLEEEVIKGNMEAFNICLYSLFCIGVWRCTTHIMMIQNSISGSALSNGDFFSFYFSKAMAAQISRLKKTHIQAYIRTRNTYQKLHGRPVD